MKRHKQLWDRMAGLDNLMEAPQDALRGKRGKRTGAAFFQIWEKEVVRLARELDEGSSWPGSALGFSPQSSPDLPQAALGFAAVGSVREERMKQVILATPKYRQRFTLEIVRHEWEDEPLFEITRCLAVGWILSESAVEE